MGYSSLQGKRPAVVAGLAASLGVMAALTAAPLSAHAEGLEPVSTADQQTDASTGCADPEGAAESSDGSGSSLLPGQGEGPSGSAGGGDLATEPSSPEDPVSDGGDLQGPAVDGEAGLEPDAPADAAGAVGDASTAPSGPADESAAPTAEPTPQVEAPAPVDAPLPATGWVVEDRGYGLQRYYVEAGKVKTGLFQAFIDGVASWFYGREDLGGAVVRGKWDDGRGHVYLADNDGRLASGSGWLVTGAYDGGTLQRYWIDGSAHAARSGYFSVGTDSYFGLGGQGYVLRGTARGVFNDWLVADNDGKLAKNEWVVTSAFGQGLQRYWFDSTATIAKQGLYDTGGGWWAYVTDKGYVLRGKLDNGRGRIYLADNDGRLVSGSGWLVTGLYDGGALQRYYIDGAAHAAVSGFFDAALAGRQGKFFGLAGQGYVLRGSTPWGATVLLADNDGFMLSGEGWVVSDAYGHGLQRYWAAPATGQTSYYGALTGFFHIVDGHAVAGQAAGSGGYYYGLPQGYVLRGSKVIAGKLYQANNDGVIAGYLNGIDVSSWQAGMNVSSIEADFVIVKVSEGTDYLNPQYRTQASQALSSGKMLGLYHFFSGGVSPEEQAEYFVKSIDPSYIGQAVLVLDWEADALYDGPAAAKRFLDRVYELTGVRSLIYMSSSVTNEYDWSDISKDYGLWVAQYLYKYYDVENGIQGYVENPTISTSGFGAWGTNAIMYQYTSTGRLDGWSGNLDFNIFYGTRDDWTELAARATKSVVKAVEAAVAVKTV